MDQLVVQAFRGIFFLVWMLFTLVAIRTRQTPNWVIGLLLAICLLSPAAVDEISLSAMGVSHGLNDEYLADSLAIEHLNELPWSDRSHFRR
jgi:Flp pilus assembly protein protease CpaA